MSLDVGETFMTSHAVDAGSIQKLEERKEFLRAIVESTRNFSQFRYVDDFCWSAGIVLML